jgi:hypothetical protein
MVLIYGAARGHSRLAKQIYGERFPQRVLPNARTCVNVVQHLRDFGCFEMNLRDLGRQRKDRILVAEEILHKVENQSRTKYSACCKLPVVVLQFTSSKRLSGNSSKQRHSASSSSCWSLHCERWQAFWATFLISFYIFTHNYSLFTLLLKPLLFSENELEAHFVNLC